MGLRRDLQRARDASALPGTRAAYEAFYQTADAELLARAAAWAGSAESAHNEVLNVTAGDQFRWSQMWPRFAERHGLVPGPIEQLVGWGV